MIAPSLKHLENRLPAEPKMFLFSAQPFERLEDIYLFSSIYPVLIGDSYLEKPISCYYSVTSTGSVCVDENGQNAISLQAWYDKKYQCVERTAETSVIAKWFKSRLDLRIAKPVREQLSLLSLSGLKWRNILSILFLQGFNDLITLDPFLYDLLENNCDNSMDQDEWERFLKKRYTAMFDMETGSSERQRFLDAGQGVLHLSSLGPDQLDFIIRKIAAGPVNDAVEKDVVFQVARTWENFRSSLGIPDFLEFKDWYKSSSAYKSKKTKPDYLPVMERMRLTEDGLSLCFIRSGEKIWYNVNPHSGQIETLNEKKGCLEKVHFALKKTGRARGNIHRGTHDILLEFVKNAMKYCSKYDPCYLNDVAQKEMIWEKLDLLTNDFLSGLDAASVGKARKLSNRYAVAWEIFGILKKYHRNSIETLRLESFVKIFPSLLKIIYPGFLSAIVIPGEPLKKKMPYWSKYIWEQAQIPPRNYQDAKDRIMKAVAVTLGAPGTISGKTVQSALEIIRFNLPFQKQLRYKEAYLVWMLKQDEFDKHAFRSWYDYIESNEYVVNRYTTRKSLERRHDQWVLDELKKKSVKNNTPFSEPWLRSGWSMNGYQICYIPDSLTLQYHASIQQNCAVSYVPKICAGKIQLYALKQQDKIIGTIEVIKERGGIALGHCAGFQNQKLTSEQLLVVDAWFPYQPDRKNEAINDVPDADIPF